MLYVTMGMRPTGNFLGIGADLAVNASVQVDAADPWDIVRPVRLQLAAAAC